MMGLLYEAEGMLQLRFTTFPVYLRNKVLAVEAGVVPPLMRFILDQSAPMLDEALAILAILNVY
jgi:hypothetical protein